MDIVAFVLWLFAGIFNLTVRKEITKLDYGLVWGILILNLVLRLTQKY